MAAAEGSEYDRLFYPFLFAGSQVSADTVLAQVRHSILEKCHETSALRRATLAQEQARMVAAGQAMAHAFAAGATLFAFGNGGSATDAHDIVVDLLAPSPGAFGMEAADPSKIQNPKSKIAQPLPALALTNDIAVVTAVGNDVHFDNIFVRQIIAFGQPGDIALGISTSGNSVNVLVALEQAKKQGLLTIALAGYDGGKLARTKAVDFCLTVPSTYIPRIQEAQATMYHALLEVVWSLLGEGG